MKDRLQIIWGKRLVGTLDRHKKGRVVFQYSQDWIGKESLPVSLSLPCRKEKFAPAVSTAFFENLLPESNTRTVLAFNRRFDKKDTFAFLENFGEDCAGALSIIPEDQEPDFTSGQYENITRELIEILDKILRDPERYKLYPEMKHAKLSLAGVQDKLPVYIKGAQFYLPKNSGSATTHIIKPINAGFTDIPRNEALCMELAQRSGFLIPNSKIMKVGGHELFVVDRYDRQEINKEIVRIHQEDFCQAMGYPAERKYQESGGPGFIECRELIDEYLSNQGVTNRFLFIRMMIFNYIIGNHDAHGKNFSILHNKGFELAPFYDLVSTQVYPLDNKFAMAIGQTFRFDRIKEHSFKIFAKDMNVRPKLLTSLVNEVCEVVKNELDGLIAEHEKNYGEAKIYKDLSEIIKSNSIQLQSFFR
ncbi:MAG: type II toxin-antitoxin system HipA family toxin [Desulfobacula sp.]|uniref:type II toxin-antitoxin system HipA family toxin n=1 Tax=Desulfobacula sp. TaxID=2593537 RepID=UPI0025BF95DE|nr:type II toxin-antitoxin system HipA family toxin [Desulfobacula sp.]MCD4719747.1 type II toxin-antitoxin system HipA family toxin [Desulfobacula sp.]